jgi:KDO2-lipid IV(A) lauroyltransferase
MTSLYKPPKIRELDQLLKRARETTGSHLVPTTAGGIRQLQQALTNRECIGLLPDQEPKGSGGVFAPFFGIPAYTMTLLTRLSSENRVPIIISFAERLPAGKGYYFHIVVPDEAIHNPDPAIAAEAINRAIEKIIRIRPEQYMWNYKRFKKRPGNEKSFYP